MTAQSGEPPPYTDAVPDSTEPHSISVIQWLLNAETSHPTSSPPHRLNRFFTTLYASLANPSRAILQFYPNSDDQINLITSIAQKAGFGGGVVIDYPNSKKARKVFLCLFVGSGGAHQNVPKGLDGEEPVEGEESVKYERRRERERRRDKSGKRKSVKAKDWILKKKEVRQAYLKFLHLPVYSVRFTSFIENEARKEFRTIPNSLEGNESLSSNLVSVSLLLFYGTMDIGLIRLRRIRTLGADANATSVN